MQARLPFKKQDGEKIIAFAGNPNVGKSTLFNTLTGMKQHTGNWTGKTVSTAVGYCKTDTRNYLLADIPGTYSLAARSAEEEVARDFILDSNPDAVVVVCDATCLERNLSLVYQIMELTPNVVVCVNLIDEAKRKGITVDLDKLSHILNLPVVGTVARKKSSAAQILFALDSLDYEKSNDKKRCDFENYSDEKIEQILKNAQTAAKSVVMRKKDPYDSPDLKADRILTSRLWGYPLMLAMLLLVFWLTIVGANYPSALLSSLFLRVQAYALTALQSINTPALVCNLIVDGVMRVLCWVVAVMLPPMLIFFPMFTLLEDLGYLPRIAYNLDKPFKCCNACGKQALTMCMGFGCNAVGVTGCRIIDSERERLIAIITNSFVPCNGRFPMLISLITMFVAVGSGFANSLLGALALTLLIAFSVLASFAASAFLSKTLLRGRPSSFTLELPPYRKPQLVKTLVRSVLDRTLFVLGRAVIVAAPAGLVIWLMANIPVADASILSHCADFLDPFARFIGMDGVILMSFILGLPANEIVLSLIVMTYLANGSVIEISSLDAVRRVLLDNGWTLSTAICTMTFTLFHFPCSTTLITIYKETKSVKWTLLSAVLPLATGIIACALINLIL